MSVLEPADELAVRSLLARYCHRCDDGDVDGVVALFTPEAAFTFGEAVAAGRAALTAFFASPALSGKHLTTNTVVEPAGPDATAVSDFLFLRRKDGRWFPALTGRYHDRLVRADGRWLFARRDAVLA